MSDKQYKRFYVDWWNIKKSTVYMLIALAVLFVASLGFLWYATRNNWFAQQELADAPQDAGRLTSFEGDVRVIRSATRETIVVTKLIYVSAGDTIQTQSDGRATIQMIDGSTLQVRPNSTVVIRDSSSLFGGKNIRVALDDGQINVKTQEQTDNTKNVVEVSQTENRLMSQTDASFNTDAATKGGEIRISRGGVESTGNGEKTVISENEFAAINNGKISSKEKLLEPPKMIAPENSSQIDSNGNADIAFRWQNGSESSQISKYYLQVSRSPVFAADGILVDRDSLTNVNYPLAGVAPGTYYWRLRATSSAGQKSVWSDPWKFTVLKRESGTQLEAGNWKVEPVGGSIYLISGKTQSGAVVRSQGREVFAAGDGSFKMQVSSSSPNVIVEIRDDKGNRSSYNLSLQTGSASKQ